jgi:hypothetical protein
MYCRPELCWLRGGGLWRNLLLFPFSALASLSACLKNGLRVAQATVSVQRAAGILPA